MVKNSKFKAVTAFLVIMSILFATLFGFASVKIINSNKQIATLQAEIESQSDVIASLQSVDEKISQLENQIESQADTINKLQNDLSAAQDNAKQWESKYNNAKAEASNQKTCYLTFDDGPSDNTLKIIEVLNKYNIKATFFVTGKSKTEYIYNGNGSFVMLTENSDYITIEDTMRLFRLRLDERDEHRDIVIKYKVGISETFKENKTARRLLSEAIENKKDYISDLNAEKAE